MTRRMCATAGIILALVGALARPAYFIISVIDAQSAQELAAVPVRPGDRIEVEYVHSMYGVQQCEVFLIDEKGWFRLTKVAFGSLAAALYYDPDPPQGMTFDGCAWVMRRSTEGSAVLRYRVSPGTGHVLKVGGQLVNLSARSPETGTLMHVRSKKSSPAKSILMSLRRRGLAASGPHRLAGRDCA